MFFTKNRYYTLMLVPEKTDQVRRIVIPAWFLRLASTGVAVAALFSLVMIVDYIYVMDQIHENKALQIETRKLRSQVQIFKNKLESIEKTIDRVQTFSTRLKVITNIEDRENLVQNLNDTPLPDAATNIGAKVAEGTEEVVLEPFLPNEKFAESLSFKEEEKKLHEKLNKTNEESLLVEQQLQDLYELLVDQKTFLSALPTRMPTNGYFTSGFGIRKSPYGYRDKMHEGVDIANHVGTPIRATASAIVTFSGKKPGYGRTVILDHGYGLETWYAHASQLAVKTQQKVKRGDVVAYIGNSGRSTGPHLHYEVRVNGIPVDPTSYILEN